MDLTSHFLIAMPAMDDPNFSQTINLICSHDQHGAMGLVLNRPTSLMVNELLSEHTNTTEKELQLTEKRVHQGGPVAVDQGFILYSDANDEREWGSTLRFGEQYCVSTSSDLLDDTALGKGPDDYLVFLGYSGWDAGQLDQEINNNVWLTLEADHQTIFNTPAEQQWHAAAARLGVDLNLMSTDYGHA